MSKLLAALDGAVLLFQLWLLQNRMDSATCVTPVTRSEAFTDYFSACFLLCTPVSTLLFTRTVLTVMITLISLLSNWSVALTCISDACDAAIDVCDSIFALSLRHAKL